MTWNPKTLATLKRLNTVKRTLKELFVDRDTAVDLLWCWLASARNICC